MRCLLLSASLLAGLSVAAPAGADVLYNNLTPSNLIGVASRQDQPGSSEIEAADDFVLASPSRIDSASFTGVITAGRLIPTITQVTVEIYRVFPNDSDTNRIPNVPTRANSPSDVAFASRDSAAAGELTFSTTALAPSFSALNSIQPGGIHPNPNPTTGGNGAITGVETQFDVTFTTPINLPDDHYFFIPQVTLSDAGQFYWLSASRPISGAGTTLIVPDLQAWTRDDALDPDWLRVGTDIVGGTVAPAPTFNQAFSLNGVTPEPGLFVATGAALALLTLRRRGGATA